MEMIQRLSKTALKQDDFEYITNFETFSVEYKRWQDGLRSEGYVDGREDGMEKGMEKGKIEANEKSAEKCLILGLSIADTMKISNLSLEEVQNIAKRLGLLN
jgi:predicted transposase/invertase (TIGR01784 family)